MKKNEFACGIVILRNESSGIYSIISVYPICKMLRFMVVYSLLGICS